MFSFRSAADRAKDNQTPAEQLKDWQRRMKRDQITLQAEITKMQREESRLMLDIRKDKRRGDDVNARAHAKLVVQTRKHAERLAVTKAQLSSVGMQLKEQQATVKMAGAMRSSTQMMQAMQGIVSAPSVAQTARQYAMEMQRAGLLQEMATDVMDDALDMAGDAVEVEDDEVDAVIAGVLGQQASTTPAQHNTATSAQASPAAQQLPHEAAGASLSGLVEAMPSAPTGGLQQHARAQTAETSTGSPMLQASGGGGGGGVSPVPAAAAQGGGGGSSPGSGSELERRLAQLA